MVANALDEILFWEDFPAFAQKIQELSKKYYPHDPESYFREKNAYLRRCITDKEELIRRLTYYETYGSPQWTSGRCTAIDDMSAKDMETALMNATDSHGAERAAMAEKIFTPHNTRFDHYANAILYTERNTVLELTIGAGLGTAAVMKKMKNSDSYFGVDIDFRCAKNADGMAKHYEIKGLGIAASLWNLPFDNGVFSAICSNCGLDECREIPTILQEAVRVLAPSGRIILSCLSPDRITMGLPFLLSYDFSEREAITWMERIRIYAGFASLDRILAGLGCAKKGSYVWENGAGQTLIYEKIS